MRIRGLRVPLLETAAAWLLGLLWLSPLAYAFWAAFHPVEFATRFDPLAPLTLGNFARAWTYAPFPRHFLNTVILVTMILSAQLVLCTLAGYAFARFDFFGRNVVGLLPGAERGLRDTYVLVSAHADHLGGVGGCGVRSGVVHPHGRARRRSGSGAVPSAAGGPGGGGGGPAEASVLAAV